METIRVKKAELLKLIVENREKHEKAYKEAIKAYRVQCADLLQKELAKTINGEEFKMHFQVDRPESHLVDYDMAIGMLNFTVDDIIELNHDEYAQYVNDDWNWKRRFHASYMSNSVYVGSTGIMGPQGSQGAYEEGSNTIDISFSEDEL